MTAVSLKRLGAFIFFSISSILAYTQTDSSSFGGKNFVSDGLAGSIYLLKSGTTALPDFDTMHARGTIYTREINIPDRSWTQGFPGVTDRFEWFAIDYHGSFKAKKAGQYIFRLTSDDGSKLFIDGKLLIDNDGLHSLNSKTGEMDLDEESHAIRLEYFQGPRTQLALQLFVKVGDQPEQIFPGNGFTLTTPHEKALTSMWWIAAIILFLILLFVIMRRRKKKKS
ncbi:MAG TPA: PA14 domain-containing protein [Chitinophagaceae bacterium]|jgi:hypothetical protein